MPLHPGEVLAIEDGLTQPSSWVTSFPLLHDSLGLGERGFDQVVTQLHQLTSPYHQHVTSTVNTCSRVSTPRSLTDTCESYHTETSE
jgi:hypothetical protein